MEETNEKSQFILVRGVFDGWNDYLTKVLSVLQGYKMEETTKVVLVKEGVYVYKKPETLK